MGNWEREARTHRGGSLTASTPSFASCLLDSIYRSLDEADATASAHAPNAQHTNRGAPHPPPPKPQPLNRHRLLPNEVAPRETLSARTKPPPPLPPVDRRRAEKSFRSRLQSSRLYIELNKARSPLSPGRRLARFLNALFAPADKTETGTRPRRSVSYEVVSDGQRAGRRSGLGSGRRGEEEEDDASSCSSSDLFELDLMVVGGKDELPLYATTYFNLEWRNSSGSLL